MNTDVQTFSKENFISLKYNAKEEIGNQLFKKYNCQGVPHLLFLDSKGNEVDRIIGFIPPTEYLLRIQDIINRRNTLNDYLSKFNDGDNSEELLASIALKYKNRKDDQKAVEFYKILLNKYPNSNSKYYKEGEFFLASYNFKTNDENALNEYILMNPNSLFNLDAYRNMVHHYANNQQIDKEILVYKQMLKAFPNDPNALNSYAWRMAEIEKDLEIALEKVKKAIMLTVKDPNMQANIIDTEAEVLWKLKRFDEAIKSIEKAILIEPENEYFKDQKNKFLSSKKEQV